MPVQVREETTLRLDIGMRYIIAGCRTLSCYLTHLWHNLIRLCCSDPEKMDANDIVAGKNIQVTINRRFERRLFLPPVLWLALQSKEKICDKNILAAKQTYRPRRYWWYRLL